MVLPRHAAAADHATVRNGRRFRPIKRRAVSAGLLVTISIAPLSTRRTLSRDESKSFYFVPHRSKKIAVTSNLQVKTADRI